MPTLWRAREIYNSIDNFKKVTNKNVELILIDNKNSNFVDTDPRITVIKCSKNIFVNPAWNLGVKLAKNEYICLLNDDIHFNFTTIINNFQKIWSEYKNVVSYKWINLSCYITIHAPIVCAKINEIRFIN